MVLQRRQIADAPVPLRGRSLVDAGSNTGQRKSSIPVKGAYRTRNRFNKNSAFPAMAQTLQAYEAYLRVRKPDEI